MGVVSIQLSIIKRLKSLRVRITLLLIIIVIVCVVVFCISKSLLHWGADKPIPNETKLVEVENTGKQDLAQTIRLLGTIHPKHNTVLVAKGSGTLKILIPTGQQVSKGTLIAKIDNPELEKNLPLSVNAANIAQAQFDRLGPLLKEGYISAKDAEEKKQSLIVAQKELARTKIELNSLSFYAPFDGIIGAYKKRDGAQVAQAEPIVTIYDPASLVVDFDIPCSNFTTIGEGQPLIVLGKQYFLTHLQKMLDEDTHMCPADVDITCDNCLIGTSVYIDLVTSAKKQVLVIPSQALFLRNNQSFVYVVEQGKVVLAAVKTGLQQQEQIEILEGLQPGQQVIIKGQERLFPGMSVEIYHSSKIVS